MSIIKTLANNEVFHIKPNAGSIQDLTGTVSGDPTMSVDPLWGSGSKGQHLAFGRIANQRLDYGDVLGAEYTVPRTWVFLAKINDGVNTQGLWGKRLSSSPWSGQSIRGIGGKMEFLMRGTTVGSSLNVTSVNDYPTDYPIVVIVSYDGTGDTATMRFNGINQTVTITDLFDNTSILNSGKYYVAFEGVSSGNTLDGDLYEYIEYDKALTDVEAEQLEKELLAQPFVLDLAKTNFQLQELYEYDENLGDELLTDGDMEASGVGDWIAGSSAILTKETTDPVNGVQNLRIAYNGVANYFAYQSGIVTTNKTYRIRGWGRGDGTFVPSIQDPSGGGAVTPLWTGTSSNSWQEFDFTYVSQGALLYFRSLAANGGYIEFDELSVKEVQTVGAWNMGLNDGVITDVSGEGNDLTQVGSLSTAPGVGGRAIKLGDDGGYVRKAVANYRSGDSSGSIEGWFKVDPSGVIKTLFMSADEVGTSYYFSYFVDALENLTVQKKNNDTIHRVVGNTIIPPDQWVYGRLISTGSEYKLYLNNTEDTPYTVTTANSGDWFDSVLLRDNVVFGNYLRSTPTLNYNGCIGGHLISSQVQSDLVYERRYLVGARKVTYQNDFSAIPVTLGTSSTDLGGYMPITGTHKISQDSNKKKWHETVGAGFTYRDSPQAYGTFQLDFNKHTSGSILYSFIASEIGTATATSQDGYTLQITSTGVIAILRSSAGVASTIMASAAGYFDNQTDYSVRITRSPADSFTMYIKGGAFTNWTQVVVTTGTNPITNSVVRSSKYQIVDNDALDKVGGFRFMLGDVTPNQVP